MATTTSKQFSLNLSDLWKGIQMSVILPILTIIQASIANGEFTLNWRTIGLTAVGGFIAYLIKNFFTPSAIVIKDATKEDMQAVKDGEAEVKVVTK